MRTRQKCVATDTWRSLWCRTTPLEHWSRRKPTVEPRWTKQQTKKLRPKPTKINCFMSGPSLSLSPTHRRAIKGGSKVINAFHPTCLKSCNKILLVYQSQSTFFVIVTKTDRLILSGLASKMNLNLTEYFVK